MRLTTWVCGEGKKSMRFWWYRAVGDTAKRIFSEISKQRHWLTNKHNDITTNRTKNEERKQWYTVFRRSRNDVKESMCFSAKRRLDDPHPITACIAIAYD